jgi:predicted membrane chloride channel (bestrophin family)
MLTPMSLVYSIKLRPFITLFLSALPFAQQDTFDSELLVPPVNRLIADPIPSLDQTGIELEIPSSTRNFSCRPLERITSIERNPGGPLEAGRTLDAIDPSAG